MIKLAGDFTLGRLVKTGETAFEIIGFLFIADLQTKNLAGLSILRHVELGHGPGYGFAHQFEPTIYVKLGALKKQSKLVSQSHVVLFRV